MAIVTDTDECRPHTVRCGRSPQCVSVLVFCDGYNDCKNHYDEGPERCGEYLQGAGRTIRPYVSYLKEMFVKTFISLDIPHLSYLSLDNHTTYYVQSCFKLFMNISEMYVHKMAIVTSISYVDNT